MKSTKVKALVKIAILIAILAVGSQISIPMVFSVPITLQMLFVALLGYILSTKQVIAAIFTYSDRSGRHACFCQFWRRAWDTI